VGQVWEYINVPGGVSLNVQTPSQFGCDVSNPAPIWFHSHKVTGDIAWMVGGAEPRSFQDTRVVTDDNIDDLTGRLSRWADQGERTPVWELSIVMANQAFQAAFWYNVKKTEMFHSRHDRLRNSMETSSWSVAQALYGQREKTARSDQIET
jgi:hypothetical protein